LSLSMLPPVVCRMTGEYFRLPGVHLFNGADAAPLRASLMWGWPMALSRLALLRYWQ
jgi:hypothetical protein